MASTNKTTNYELSQYIGTDKPTYLTDYNQDMSKIDAGIHAAKSEADTNATSIGDLTSLTTTAKTSLVAAANEIDADVATNTNNIATNTSNIATNTTHIGTVANLTTSAKTDLVVAANEINAKVGNLSNLKTTTKTSAVGAINELYGLFDFSSITSYSKNDMTIDTGDIVEGSITVATNSDKSICKIYGQISTNNGNNSKITLDTNFNVDNEFSVTYTGYSYNRNSLTVTGTTTITFKTNGKIELSVGNGTNISFYNPVVIFVKDFGDQPE